MSLPHALLTALIERPGSGLELAGRFDRSIGHFWSATHQQIYRELARLEQNKLIESEPEVDARGRKRVYRVLPEGREELSRWIARDDELPPFRDAFMVRLRAEAAIGPAGLEATIHRRMKGHQEKLGQYRQIEQRDFSRPPQDRATALRHLILKSGIRHEESWIEILMMALDALDAEPSHEGD